MVVPEMDYRLTPHAFRPRVTQRPKISPAHMREKDKMLYFALRAKHKNNNLLFSLTPLVFYSFSHLPSSFISLPSSLHISARVKQNKVMK
jgi:hypothetical protein